MICPNCFKQIKDDSKFCIHCGADIEKIIKQEQEMQETLKKREENQSDYKKPYFGEKLKTISKILFGINCIGSIFLSVTKNQEIIGGYYTGYDTISKTEFNFPIFMIFIMASLISSVLIWCLGEHLSNQHKQIELLEKLNNK